ncbi:hypothetical protein [Clostridium oceanicum]|uniref:Uncharacterized protein n=1 Tax=Clostridium oceanicum TaxID=1543 RepID=A0ABN1J8K3_9CLOT
MKHYCPKCNGELKKGMLCKIPMTAVPFVKFNYDVETFNSSDEPIISPYVCRECGYVEWYIDNKGALK